MALLKSAPDSIKLQATLDTVTAMLPVLASDYEDAAFQHEISPSPAAQSTLKDATAKLHAARDRQASLTAAIEVAKAREADQHAKAFASTRKAQVNSLRVRLRNRDDVVAELSSALAAVATHWGKLVESNAGIEHLCHELGVDPARDNGGGFLIARNELTQAMAIELGRVAQNLPAPVRLLGDPNKLTPLADQISGARDYLLRRLTGEKQQ
jgi:hypothetical protein